MKTTAFKKREVKFQKLSLYQKRIAIAKDVIARIRTEQFKPTEGLFISPFISPPDDNTQICEIVNKKQRCQVCAKGGLFMSYIGYVNNFTFGDLSYGTKERVNLDNDEMRTLSRIFTRKQLSLIETAFEKDEFSWNMPLSENEVNRCFDFYWQFYNSNERLIGICQNIIENKGIFRP